jgi:cytochrome c oxidase subunit III
MAQVSLPADDGSERTSTILFGTILFLSSELLFFGGLFAAYFSLRAETEPWPPSDVELSVGLVAAATVLLVASSITMQAALRAGEHRQPRVMRRWILASMALGLSFLAIQVWDYAHLPFEVSSNAYGTMFYAMTGFHGLHVVAGIVLMAVVLGRMAQGAYRDGNLEGAHAIGYYWHFVDVVWLALFATIYLVR